jgi:hypothetical protein
MHALARRVKYLHDLPSHGTNATTCKRCLRTVPDMANTPTVGRRIKAAIALAGYSIEDLSEAIDQRGLGPRTLRKLQDDSDPREPRAWELRAIADACDVPYRWFTVDSFKEAIDGAGQRPDLESDVAEMRAELGELADAVTELRAAVVALSADSLTRTQAQSERPASDHRPRRGATGE